MGKIEDKDIDLHIDRETLLQEYIPKAQYEQRLKADMVAMLSEVKDTVKHCEITGLWKANYQEGFNDGVAKSLDAIQQKIDVLKEETND